MRRSSRSSSRARAPNSEVSPVATWRAFDAKLPPASARHLVEFGAIRSRTRFSSAWASASPPSAAARIQAVASLALRAGRDEMRDTLMRWLPDDLRGARLLDAGCGTGALAVLAALLPLAAVVGLVVLLVMSVR